MNTETFWHEVAQRLDAGTPVFVSLVAANTHGSPGTLGARLLVDATGTVAGTIGGGIMEANLVEEAHRLLQQDAHTPPELRLLVHRKKGTEHPSGLICAGEQTNINLILRPEHDAHAIQLFHQAITSIDAPAATLTIDADGLRVAETESEPGIVLSESNTGWSYRESSINPKRLAIIGGGHCGKALADLAIRIGYRVDVFDTRNDVLNEPEWPTGARSHALTDYDELDKQLRHPILTTVVVMTAAVTHDITALATLAPVRPPWLGVMGSTAKIHEIRRRLIERGISRELINAIHGPIGLPMKSDTPAEIAVSIMGQLLADQATSGHEGAGKRDRRYKQEQPI